MVILSDSYDTDPSELLGEGLACLCRSTLQIVWLNPLAGWRDYAPVAAGMTVALPHLDAFLPAHTLGSLAAREAELPRL